MQTLTEHQIRQQLTSEDDKRESIQIEIIDEPILAPGLIELSPKAEPTAKRVSLTNERLT